jgi:hypothetical protein
MIDAYQKSRDRLVGIDRIRPSPKRFNKKTPGQTLCGANTTIDSMATSSKEKKEP